MPDPVQFQPEIMQAPVDVVNRALALFGGGHIMSLDDEGDLQRQAALLYFTQLDWALSLHPWHFCMRPVVLSQIAGDPQSGYRYHFELPADRMGDPIRYQETARSRAQLITDFVVMSGAFHCDKPTCCAITKFRANPTDWPATFSVAFITLLASSLAVPVSHDTGLAQSLRYQAIGDERFGGTGGLMAVAIAKEVALSPPQDTPQADQLTSARFEGHGPWHGDIR